MADKAPIIIIKKGGEAGHAAHGGAWKVAYADFVTAMMAFFMVMWLMGADEETKAAIESYFNDPGSNTPVGNFERNLLGGDQVAALRELRMPGGRTIDFDAGKTTTAADVDPEIQNIKEALEQSIVFEVGQTAMTDRLQMKYDSQGFILQIATKDFFDQGSSEIRPDLQPLLRKIGEILSKTDRLIRIEGHAEPSETAGSKYSSSWELSTARATEVVKYWMKEFDKWEPKRIQVAGDGHYRPLASSDSKWGQRANRRVEIVILNNKYQQP